MLFCVQLVILIELTVIICCRPYIIVDKGRPRVTNLHIQELTQGVRLVWTTTCD